MTEQELKKKPPILDWIKQTEIYDLWLKCQETAGDLLIRGIEAQRDADIEWFQQAGYVKLADDQSLPENPTLISTRWDDPRYMDRLAHEEYDKAQQDMLKANFRKVEL